MQNLQRPQREEIEVLLLGGSHLLSKVRGRMEVPKKNSESFITVSEIKSGNFDQ